jgi:hypothetical protein
MANKKITTKSAKSFCIIIKDNIKTDKMKLKEVLAFA